MIVELTAIRTLLKNRVGFRQESRFALTLDADNLQTDSAIVFQSEYTFMTLQNIYETMEYANATELEFNEHLKNLREDTVMKVLTDVFRNRTIEQEYIDCNLSAFDTAISQRLAIVVGEQILMNTRSNRTERMTKQFMQRVFFELNGNTTERGSSPNKNFPTYVGLKSRYGFEIDKLRDLFNTGEKLDCFTMGIPDREYIYDEQYRSEFP